MKSDKYPGASPCNDLKTKTQFSNLEKLKLEQCDQTFDNQSTV